MGVELQPLEFTDCLNDSPLFRENLHKHENELNKTSQQIKRLIKEVKDLLTAAKNLSRAQRCLSESLADFSFECIGGSQTDDEMVISQSLKEFGKLISAIEDERDRMLERAFDQIILPLENFRKEHIGGVKEEKKKFDKQTAKFCQVQERCLNMSTKKQDAVLLEADVLLEMAERNFCHASLHYVFRLQEVQERKKFEFVETLLGFMFGWLTFYHQGHEVAKDFKPYMSELQFRIQKTRENFIETRNKTQSLKEKMLEMRQQKVEEPGRASKSYSKEGYLFLMEKKAFGTTTWTKQYCTYQKETKEFTMTPFNQLTSAKSPIASPTVMVLSSCIRRMSETIDKRFCFDVCCEQRPGLVFTLQALSENDRKAWMDVMDGKEPTYSAQGKIVKQEEHALDDVGFKFVRKCIEVLESRGLEEQGLYRVVGVASKVNKLLAMGLDRRKAEKLASTLDDRLEWESKTITSALKTYLRNLPEPIMTFRYHNGFIAAAKQETRTLRTNDVHTLVHRLPKSNIEMLDILIKHLKNVVAKSDKNLMSVSNLAVCFGPTLLRPEEETVASIMDIKFYNVVVEILIENYEKIFKTTPTNETQKNDGKETSPPATFNISNSTNAIINNMQMRNSQQPSHHVQHRQQQQMAGYNQPSNRYGVNVYNTSSSSPPVTHAVIKTYYDGPLAVNLNSHSVNDMQQQQHEGREIMINGGSGMLPPPASYMTHSEHHLVSASTGNVGATNSQMLSSSRPNLTVHNYRNTNDKATSSSTSNVTTPPISAAYSENNIHNTQIYSSPLHNKHKLSAPFQNNSADIRNDTLNSTSSSNESMSSLSPHDFITENVPTSTLLPQKSKREIKSIGAHYYAKGYRAHGGGGGVGPPGSGGSMSPHCISSPSASGRSSPANYTVRRVRTLYACLGENDGELSFEPNQIITNVKNSMEPGWLEGTLNGKTGLVPENYVEMLP